MTESQRNRWCWLFWFWVFPWNAVGLIIGVATIMSRGSVRRVDRTLEVHGGVARWLLEQTPVDAIAMTIGHVIIGRTAAALDVTRDHERVHVRQYEFWGPFFVPVYFWLSFYVWLQGKNAYRDNPFEVEAFTKSNPEHPDQ